MTSITIFPPFTPLKSLLINKLESMDYPVFIDSEHKYDERWINRKYDALNSTDLCHMVLFQIKETVVIAHTEPDIMLEIFLEEPKWYDYESFEEWFTTLLSTTVDINLPKSERIILKQPAPYVNPVNDYELRTQPLNNMMFYEVVQRYVQVPYVTVVHNFKESGHLKFFTNLFVCKSWGICAEDIKFLRQCWVFLDMPGEFNLEKLLQGTKFDVPPKVWRSTLFEVLEIQNKLNGFYFLFFLTTCLASSASLLSSLVRNCLLASISNLLFEGLILGAAKEFDVTAYSCSATCFFSCFNIAASYIVLNVAPKSL